MASLKMKAGCTKVAQISCARRTTSTDIPSRHYMRMTCCDDSHKTLKRRQLTRTTHLTTRHSPSLTTLVTLYPVTRDLWPMTHEPCAPYSPTLRILHSIFHFHSLSLVTPPRYRLLTMLNRKSSTIARSGLAMQCWGERGQGWEWVGASEH